MFVGFSSLSESCSIALELRSAANSIRFLVGWVVVVFSGDPTPMHAAGFEPITNLAKCAKNVTLKKGGWGIFGVNSVLFFPTMTF